MDFPFFGFSLDSRPRPLPRLTTTKKTQKTSTIKINQAPCAASTSSPWRSSARRRSQPRGRGACASGEQEFSFRELKEKRERAAATTTSFFFLFFFLSFFLSLSFFLAHRLFFSSLESNTNSSTTKNSEASPPDLEALANDLPDDHPFAVRADVSPEEAKLAKARLRVRRGLPLRDLSGARGFSSDEEKR